MEGEDDRPEAAAERRANRPYRRVVGLLFAALLLVVAFGVLRGVIQRLDRLPSVESFTPPDRVDDRALRACAEDLDRLEARIRTTAGRSFARDPRAPETPDWQEESEQLETERLRIVARCRLHESGTDAVVTDLTTAADQLETMLRSYNLLFDRHAADGEKASMEVRAALERALAALRSR